MKDPTAENFPWIPPTHKEAIGSELVKADGSKIDAKTLEGKYLALYFSASWCGPCKGAEIDALHKKTLAWLLASRHVLRSACAVQSR